MAGFLSEIGSGLRFAGSALAGAGSRDVYHEQAQERGRVKEAGRDRQAKVAEIMMRAIQSGQIPDEHIPEMHQALSKMGYSVPLNALGATPEAREKLGQYARDKTARERTTKAESSMVNLWDTPPGTQAPGLGLPGANAGLRGEGPAPLPMVQPQALDQVLGAAPGMNQSMPAPGQLPAMELPASPSPAAAAPAPLTDSPWPPDVPPPRDIPYGEYSHTKRDTPDGYPKQGDYEQDEREQLALGGMTPNKIDKFLYREELGRSNNIDGGSVDPAYPTDVLPPGLTGEVEGKRYSQSGATGQGTSGFAESRPPPPPLPQPRLRSLFGQMPGATPQQSTGGAVQPAQVAAAPAQEPMVPGPIPGGGLVPASLMTRWKQIVEAHNAGVPVGKELFKEMLSQMYPSKKDYLTVGEGQTVIDPTTGKVVHQGPPKASALSDIGKLMGERDALIARDPNHPDIAKYEAEIDSKTQAKGATLSDLGKYQSERDALAARNPNHPALPIYDRTIANFKAASNAKDDTFKNANTLRDEFNMGSKNFAAIANARRQIIEAAKDNTGAGDLSLLYGYMKSLDPNSVVRESEFAMAAQAGSLPERIQGWATKIINGERLDDDVRVDFVNQSAKLYDAAVVDQDKHIERYRRIAERNNLPVEDVIGDFSTESKMGGAAAAATVTKPATATTKQRKTFKGVEYEEIGAGRWRKLTK